MYHTVYDITVLPGRDAKTNRHLWSERSQTTAIVLCSYSRSRVSAELLCSSSEPLERFNTPTVGERRWKRTQEWERELTALSLTLEGKLGKTSAGDTSGSVTAALPNADGSSCCPQTWPGPSCAGDVAELWNPSLSWILWFWHTGCCWANSNLNKILITKKKGHFLRINSARQPLKMPWFIWSCYVLEQLVINLDFVP